MEPHEEVARRGSDRNHDGDDSVPVGLFGNDHWSLLLKVDEAINNNDGVLNTARLNIARSKRRSFAPNPRFPAEYPTQVKASEVLRTDGRYGVRKIHGHDDLDCLGDLERAGLLEAEMPMVSDEHFVDVTGKVVLDDSGEPLSPYADAESLECIILKHTRLKLTDYGVAVAFQLRLYKDAGNHIHSFTPPAS